MYIPNIMRSSISRSFSLSQTETPPVKLSLRVPCRTAPGNLSSTLRLYEFGCSGYFVPKSGIIQYLSVFCVRLISLGICLQVLSSVACVWIEFLCKAEQYFILCSQSWRSSIQSAKTRPGVDCGSDHELLIAKFRLKFKKVGKTTRPFRYDLNQIPYDYYSASEK